MLHNSKRRELAGGASSDLARSRGRAISDISTSVKDASGETPSLSGNMRVDVSHCCPEHRGVWGTTGFLFAKEKRECPRCQAEREKMELLEPEFSTPPTSTEGEGSRIDSEHLEPILLRSVVAASMAPSARTNQIARSTSSRTLGCPEYACYSHAGRLGLQKRVKFRRPGATTIHHPQPLVVQPNSHSKRTAGTGEASIESSEPYAPAVLLRPHPMFDRVCTSPLLPWDRIPYFLELDTQAKDIDSTGDQGGSQADNNSKGWGWHGDGCRERERASSNGCTVGERAKKEGGNGKQKVGRRLWLWRLRPHWPRLNMGGHRAAGKDAHHSGAEEESGYWWTSQSVRDSDEEKVSPTR
ncbi:unnamed protein product [Choristocarpus tenellus]